MEVFERFDGKHFDDAQGMWAEERPYGTCTFLNATPIALLESKGHSCVMFGRSENSFAGTPWDTEFDCATGHDWLLVDDRWLIDLWIAPYLGVNRSVMDLRAPDDARLVAHIYGPRELWIPDSPENTKARQFHPEDFASEINDIRLSANPETPRMHRTRAPEPVGVAIAAPEDASPSV